jgi:radical SAM superfamily enzyme YgiQ (UPF0313 family)
MSRREMAARGWTECDVILVTGDAYVDHPAFGAALIGRWLEKLGYRVGILAQPNIRRPEAFRELGRPRLCWGVTAGNLDSELARLTVMRKLRRDDAYSPAGRAGLRPRNACIVYTNCARHAFPGVPVVLGGLEASLRRLAYYDYWTDRIRRSLLLDAKADLLVYGMGERAIAEIALRLKAGRPCNDIPGTVVAAKESDLPPDCVELPAYEEVAESSEKGRREFLRMALAIEQAAHSGADRNGTKIKLPTPYPSQEGIRYKALETSKFPSLEGVGVGAPFWLSSPTHGSASGGNFAAFGTDRCLVQRHGDRVVLVQPPAAPLTSAELDSVYDLPFTRRPHPAYGRARIPAFDMIKDSITTHRGCFGGCSFCAVMAHQGATVISRSEKSIIREVARLAGAPGFGGIISDLGGPTANMFGLACRLNRGGCAGRTCLFPEICRNLNTDTGPMRRLLRAALAVKGVKRVFVSSGVRYDLALAEADEAWLQELVARHVGGRLKIAPEHVSAHVLALMRKPPPTVYRRFSERFRALARQAGKPHELAEYFISGHPGCTSGDMIELAQYLRKNRARPEQVQDYYPAPLTLSAAMYYTGLNPWTGQIIPVARTDREKADQRALLLCHLPEFQRKARAVLRAAGRNDLIGFGPHCLVPPDRRPQR